MVRVQLGPQRGCRAVSRRGRGQGPRLVDVLATGQGTNPVGEYGSPSREREAAVAGADPAQPTSLRITTLRPAASHSILPYLPTRPSCLSSYDNPLLASLRKRDRYSTAAATCIISLIKRAARERTSLRPGPSPILKAPKSALDHPAKVRPPDEDGPPRSPRHEHFRVHDDSGTRRTAWRKVLDRLNQPIGEQMHLLEEENQAADEHPSKRRVGVTA